MEMEDQYTISDLRQFISRASAAATPTGGQLFPPYHHPQPPELFSSHHHHPPPPSQQQYQMLMMGAGGRHVTDVLHQQLARAGGVISGVHHHHVQQQQQQQHQDQFNSDSTTTTATAATATNSGGFDVADGSGVGSARWPRQETLTLLEIRSRLDFKFKEANQKGPLWDEVARIMADEHGYQRSGKKCREKFENLYKYYKKTKEGKAGRQDGKHYRFFRQLEALYGDHQTHIPDSTTPPPPPPPQNTHIIPGNTPHFHNNHISTQPTDHHLDVQPPRGYDTNTSLSTSSGFDDDPLSSDGDEINGSTESNGSMETMDKNKGKMRKKKNKKRNWKAKIKEFIDLQVTKIIEKQEAWLERMMKTIENREKERMEREEEWRKQEAARLDRDHKQWASERAWIEARDSALMKALEKMTSTNSNNKRAGGDPSWLDPEVTRLIQLRTNMDSRFQQCGSFSSEELPFAYQAHPKISPSVCKEKWDDINKCFEEKNNNNIKEGNKKRKENIYGVNINSININNNDNNNHEVGLFHNNCEINDEPTKLQLVNEGSSSSPSSHNSNVNVNAAGNLVNDSCFRFFLGDGGTLGWENNN